jgi:hypothetical protein
VHRASCFAAADTLKRLLEQSAANKAKNAKAIAVGIKRRTSPNSEHSLQCAGNNEVVTISGTSMGVRYGLAMPQDKYCYRQAEIGVGDCGGLRYIPGERVWTQQRVIAKHDRQ